MANVKLSQIASGGAFVVATDNVVTVRNGNTDVLTSLGTLATQSGTFSGTSSGTNTGDQTITLTADVTGSGTGSFATTLATVNSNVGSFGSSTSIPSITVNGKGLVTAASGNAVIAPAGTLTGATLAAGVTASSLTSVGTIATGVWNGTAIPGQYGGTGINTNATSGFATVAAGTWSIANTVPSGTVLGTSDTQTLTNKRVTKRTGTTTSSATPTINTDNVDFYSITAQTVDITSFTTNLSGTPTEAQTLWIAITGTAARAISWGASFEASTVALPTTTVTTARLDIGFVWNTVSNKWRCVATA